MPVVRAIMSTRLEGSVVVLTKSNDEALTVTGLLQNLGVWRNPRRPSYLL